MNYQRIYEELINRAKNRTLADYTEKHHVVPKCMGGSDCASNLVSLTPEEHYLAHQLLVKIHPESLLLAKAAAMMIPGRPSNKLYGWLRRLLAKAQSESQSGTGNSQYGTKWITNGTEEKKIPKDATPDEGWKEGRKSRKSSNLKPESAPDEEKLLSRAREKEQKVNRLRSLHEIYTEEGFDGVRKTGYTKSKANLVMQFARYLPEFVPQNGKRRGNRAPTSVRP